jgi:hypothetical protein
MEEKGEIPDSVFDECDIDCLHDGVNKEGLIVNRRRSCILTNHAFIAKEKAKAEAKKRAQTSNRSSANAQARKKQRKTAIPELSTSPESSDDDGDITEDYRVPEQPRTSISKYNTRFEATL